MPAVADGGVVGAVVEMQLDHPAVQRLVQRVERQRALERRGGGVAVAPLGLLLGEIGQPGDRQIMQLAPLEAEPFLEPGFAQPEPVEQRAAIELSCRPQRLQAAVSRRAAQQRDVDLDGRPVERDGVAPRDQQRGAVAGAADRGQGLIQAVPRLHVAAIAPQQGHQPFALALLARPAGQHREQGLGLAGGQHDRRAVGALRREAAQKSQANSRHRFALIDHRSLFHPAIIFLSRVKKRR